MALAIGGPAPYVLTRLGTTPLLAIFVSVMLCTWAVLGIGPPLDVWRHTGHHHTIAGKMSKQRFVTTT